MANVNPIPGARVVTSDPATDMAAYDMLPVLLRDELKEAPLNISAVSVWRTMTSLGSEAALYGLRLTKEKLRVCYAREVEQCPIS